MIPKVVSWKKDTVNDLHGLLTSGETIAVIDIHGVPAAAMFGMRAELREHMKIQVAKKRLMKLAWERAGFDFADLEKLYDSAVQPALVSSSSLNSFEMFTELKKTEAGRAAKPGDVAPHQIVVEKQDTGMPPGPIVGDLNSVGIPAKIMGGSVQIQKRTVVLEEGEVFEGDLGMMLSKIGINPMVTGLRLCGTLEGGTLFEPTTLDIDYEQFEQDLIGMAAGAFNLACNITWFTPTNDADPPCQSQWRSAGRRTGSSGCHRRNASTPGGTSPRQRTWRCWYAQPRRTRRRIGCHDGRCC